MSEIDTDSTAFYRRNAEFVLEIKAIFDSQDDYSVNKKWLDPFYAEMQPHFDGAYLNYFDSDLPDWKEAYYGSHYETLVNIKQRFDPSNLSCLNRVLDQRQVSNHPVSQVNCGLRS